MCTLWGTLTFQGVFTPHHVGHCYINLIQWHCCASDHSCTNAIRGNCCFFGHSCTNVIHVLQRWPIVSPLRNNDPRLCRLTIVVRKNTTDRHGRPLKVSFAHIWVWRTPENTHCYIVQPVLALRRFALQNFAHTNFYNEAHTLCLARLTNANSLIRNFPEKIEHVLTKTQTKGATWPSQFVKPREVQESVRLTLCFSVQLVKDVNNLFPLLICLLPPIKLLLSLFFWLFFGRSGTQPPIMTLRLWEIATRFTNSL
jgi:hypothetical protein